MGWEPLPSDVAEWMGMDLDMLPFALDLAGLGARWSSTEGEAN